MSVTVFLGKNGAGKDMAAVQYGVLTCWAFGRQVVANCSLYPEELGLDPGLYLPLNEPLHDLPRLGRHIKRMCRECRAKQHPQADQCRLCGGVLVDVPRLHPDGGLWSITSNKGVGLLLSDITTTFPSRETLGVPPELAQTLQQLRKPDIAPVMITCPAFSRVDLMIRECATMVVESAPWNPLGGFSSVFREAPEFPWGWGYNKAFRRTFYDAELYEKADASGNWGQCPPLPHGFWKKSSLLTWRPKDIRRIQRAYDSFEDIELADHIACNECGGKLPRHSCKDPVGHRVHARSMRAQRDEARYPIPALPALAADDEARLIAALSAPDADELRQAELVEAGDPRGLLPVPEVAA